MTSQPAAFLDRLKNLPDDELALALASDPELFKKAQKALTEAKRQETEAARVRSEVNFRSKGEAFDPKAWSRARTLITGPHNESNSKELVTVLAKTNVNSSSEGQPSLLCLALAYLAEKQMVTFEWPAELFKAGARLEYEEVESFFRLLSKRSNFHNLGDKSSIFFHEILNLPLAWADFEKRLIVAKVLPDTKGLINFLFDRSPDFIGSYARVSKTFKAWDALANLARRGCQPLAAEGSTNYSSSVVLRWQSLASLKPEDEETASAKVAAFATLIDQGWCDKGCSVPTDNLQPPAGTSLFLLPGNSVTIPPLIDVGSRAALSTLCLHPSSVAIFDMICDREERIGFPRLDALGRSRLYWVNERSRVTGADPAIIGAWAQRCLDLGDSPESVNAQNPLAKCHLGSLRTMLSSHIERRELSHSTPTNNSAASAPRKRSL